MASTRPGKVISEPSAKAKEEDENPRMLTYYTYSGEEERLCWHYNTEHSLKDMGVIKRSPMELEEIERTRKKRRSGAAMAAACSSSAEAVVAAPSSELSPAFLKASDVDEDEAIIDLA